MGEYESDITIGKDGATLSLSDYYGKCNNTAPGATVVTVPTEEKKPQENDPVEHPAHYNSHPSGVECIEIVKHYDFCIGNVIKYVWRAGLKKEEGMSDLEKELEDLKKARWYLDQEIKDLEKKVEK